MGILDFDVVDESNLQRQVLHNTDTIGTPKTESAKAALKKLNPAINIITHEAMLDSSNVDEIFSQYDYVVDGTDNFPTRYLINDACVKLKEAQHPRLGVPFRGSSNGVRPLFRWPLLPLLVPRTTTTGTGSFLRRSWRAGRAAWHHWLLASHGDHQAHHRRGGTTGWQATNLRWSKEPLRYQVPVQRS